MHPNQEIARLIAILGSHAMRVTGDAVRPASTPPGAGTLFHGVSRLGNKMVDDAVSLLPSEKMIVTVKDN